ncbi:hypothetical protein AAMO2058_001547300 [Amorphochlora amoebiformis]
MLRRLRATLTPYRFMSTGNKIKAIGTHSGTFHCDEALACYMLKLLPEFKAAEVVRSRDPKVLEELPVLVDVGGVYDAGKHRYDHHQRGFNEVFGRGFNVKLSSAGLVYKHFGKRIISQVTGITDEKKIDVLFLKVYDGFIQALDGIDNGVEMIDGGGPKKYRISTDLSSRVKYLNPAWNEDNSDIQERFERAMALTGSEFKACLSRYTKSWLPAREVVQKAILDRKNVHSSGSIVLLEAYCSWQSHLFDLEQELKLLKGSEPPTLLYVLYPDSSLKPKNDTRRNAKAPSYPACPCQRAGVVSVARNYQKNPRSRGVFLHMQMGLWAGMLRKKEFWRWLRSLSPWVPRKSPLSAHVSQKVSFLFRLKSFGQVCK